MFVLWMPWFVKVLLSCELGGGLLLAALAAPNQISGTSFSK